MIRLVAAAGAFSATVVGGFFVGLLVARLTGAGVWMPVGLFAGLVLGIVAIVLALRPLLRQN
ncbi:MAG: hypothetical protein JWN27_89 [Candidatus Eremiobacteraeota bacterium]|jgi:hypothetical protein|nr:hypothetical protein [Candidatus Eremiobacteraeota bacterium]